MKKLCLVVMLFAVTSVQAQDLVRAQSTTQGEEKTTAPSTLIAYTKWRTDTLLNYPQGLLTPHYAVAIVAQRLDDSTAQVELLLAAEMKHYVISIKPVTLNRLASGETESKSAGNAVTIDQKAGEKLNNGPEATQLGQTMTLVPVTKAVQALEVTWTPKNDKSNDPSNTCIIQLGKEPTVTVNGYILGAPVK
ncbi:MAG: hypothetical protein ABI977_15635 [Acidobacteriota bacterium]